MHPATWICLTPAASWWLSTDCIEWYWRLFFGWSAKWKCSVELYRQMRVFLPFVNSYIPLSKRPKGQKDTVCVISNTKMYRWTIFLLPKCTVELFLSTTKISATVKILLKRKLFSFKTQRKTTWIKTRFLSSNIPESKIYHFTFCSYR